MHGVTSLGAEGMALPGRGILEARSVWELFCDLREACVQSQAA